MSLEQNKAIALRFYEVFDQQDVEQARELMSPDIVGQGLTVEPVRGIEAVMQYGAMMFIAFPDGRHAIEELVAEGDRVVTRGTFSGTHKGELMGLPPTGKRVAFSVIHVDRIVDGKVVEHWGQGDRLSLMQQLGIVTVPGPKLALPVFKGMMLKLFRKAA